MIAIDSNILIYYLDPTLKENKHVTDYVEEIIRREEILTSTVIWLEVSHYLYRVSPVSREKHDSRICIISAFKVVTKNIKSGREDHK